MRRRVPLAVACRWIALAVLLAARAAGAGVDQAAEAGIRAAQRADAATG